MLQALAALLTAAALLASLNERFWRLPATVGVTVAGAGLALALLALEGAGLPGADWARRNLQSLDFGNLLLNVLLGPLLFAGALGLNARQMTAQLPSVLTLALVSTLISAGLLGMGSYAIFSALGLSVPLLGALLLGALLSPTDPVAVLDLLKRNRVPARLETLIAGESLLNDGVGVVLFAALSGMMGNGHATGDHPALGALTLFAREALGGALFGAILGLLGRWLLPRASATLGLLLSAALVLGGYALAATLHLSGPLAMVALGLTLSAQRQHLPEGGHALLEFWEDIDQLLNLALFTFIGLATLLIPLNTVYALAGIGVIAVTLAARFISVTAPLSFFRREYGPYTARLLTWGGLRGVIALSLALSLPPSPYRAALLSVTHITVLFSIVVQGLSVMPLVRRAAASLPEVHKPHAASE